jgi:hypothetical protein
MQRFLLVLCALCICVGTRASAQTLSTKGKEFWVSFMENNSSSPSVLRLFFAADTITRVTLLAPGRAAQVLTINPGSTQFADFTGDSQVYNFLSNNTRSSAIFVSADNPVSVYAFNTMQASTDATMVLPVESLDNDYYVFSRAENQGLRSEFMIIGVADGTQVEITPSAPIVASLNVNQIVRPAGIPYTINLNRGQVYFAKGSVSGSTQNGDLTGTRIRTSGDACKKIAVFSGHSRTAIIASNSGSRDHLFEQMLPVSTWGQNFLTPRFPNNGPAEIRIIAKENGTVINTNSAGNFTLNSGQFTVLPRITGILSINANKPVAVMQYMHTNNGGTTAIPGDPFMMWIAPVEQVIDRITFNCFNPATSGLWFQNMFVSIVVQTASMGNSTLDGLPFASIPPFGGVFNPPSVITSDATTINGIAYTVLTVNVAVGNHTIQSPTGCLVNVFGLAQVDSYGFLVGGTLNNLNTRISINGLLPDSTICPAQTLTLSGSSADSALVRSWLWLLPDGRQVNNQSTTLNLADTGTFTVKLVVDRNSGCRFDTVTRQIRVKNDLSLLIRDTALCADITTLRLNAQISGAAQPLSFEWQSRDTSLKFIADADKPGPLLQLPAKPGTYQVSLRIADANGCSRSDTSVLITVLPLPQLQITPAQTICLRDTAAFTASVSGGSGAPYTINWQGKSGILAGDKDSTLLIHHNAPGTFIYTVTVSDSKGCQKTDSVRLTVLDQPIVSAGDDIRILCVGDSTSIGAGGFISGGQPPYKVKWSRISPGNANIISDTSLQTIVYPTLPGFYVVKATDDLGCFGLDTVFCDVRLIPDANAGPDQQECVCDRVGVDIGVPARCGVPPFQYSWKALGQAPITALSATNTVPVKVLINDNPTVSTVYEYELTVRDAQDQVRSDTMRYTLHPCPEIDAGNIPFVCGPADTFTLQPLTKGIADSLLRFRWTPSLFLSDSNSRNPLITLPTDTNISILYTVQAIAPTGCLASDTVRISTAPRLVIKATITKEKDACICRGDSIRLNASVQGGSPGYAFEWRGQNIDSALNPSAIATPLVSGIYRVTVTDAQGCTASDTISVCVEPVPNPRPGNDTTICLGDSLRRGSEATCGKPPFRYEWSPAEGVSDPNAASPLFSPTRSTTYFLRVTDDNGNGASTIASMSITVNNVPSLSLGPDVTLCAGSPAIITAIASGGRGNPYTYSWTLNGAPVTLRDSVLIIPNVDSDALIGCSISDGNTCSASSTVRLKVNQLPQISIENQVFMCPCDSLRIGGIASGLNPPFTYRWRDESGRAAQFISDTSAPQPLIFPPDSRTYFLHITDAAGCSIIVPQNIQVGDGSRQAQFSIPDIKADPRNKNLIIPIGVAIQGGLGRCQPRALEFSLDYDSRLFDPSPRINKGSILQNRLINDTVRTLLIRMQPVQLADSMTVLTTVNGAALLGNPGRTELRVHDIQWNCSELFSNEVSGSMELDSLCLKPFGNRRLLNFGNIIRILSIAPNPADGHTFISLQRTVLGAAPVDVIISSMSGNELIRHKWPVNTNATGDEEQYTMAVNLSTLSQGVYRILLVQDDIVQSEQLVIVR